MSGQVIYRGEERKGGGSADAAAAAHTDKYLPFIKANAERTNGEKKEEERIGKKDKRGKDVFLFCTSSFSKMRYSRVRLGSRFFIEKSSLNCIWLCPSMGTIAAIAAVKCQYKNQDQLFLVPIKAEVSLDTEQGQSHNEQKLDGG